MGTDLVSFVWAVKVLVVNLSHGTFSNTEQQDLNFTKHSLTHLLELWEQELNLKLFTGRNKTGFVEFNIDGLLRGDFATRMTGLTAGVNSALITPNEGRALDNRPPKENGDDLYIQGATVKLGTPPAATTKPVAAPAKTDPAKTGTE